MDNIEEENISEQEESLIDDNLTPQKYLLNYPLYKTIDLTSITPITALEYIFYTGSIECFCPKCKKHSIFNSTHSVNQRIRNSTFDKMAWIKNFYEQVDDNPIAPYHYKNFDHGWAFQCAYNPEHTINFYMKILDNRLFKYGQYPSQIDLTSDLLDKYRNVLDNQKFDELRRSYQLFTYTLGIGSMSYLRRVFEYLIEEVHNQRVKEDKDWNEDEYKQKTVNQRVEFLKDFLPPYLVEHRTYIYEILSKGIHELSEKECLEHYPTILTSIQLILDEKIYLKGVKKTIKDNKTNLKRIHTNISSK